MKTVLGSVLLVVIVLVSAVHAADDWTQKFPSPKPSGRWLHAMTFIGEDQVLLFGGWDGSNRINDTWVYDLSADTWTNMSPSNPPSARDGHAMAYIGGDQVLLFGGWDVLPDDETWVYDLSDNTWTQKSPLTKPSARYKLAMVYMGGDQVLLFSGTGYQNDTWVYDLSDNTWTNKNPSTKPSGRLSHAMAYIGGDQALLFGGWGGGGIIFNDTWVYDLSDNTWTNKNPSTKPSVRYRHAMAYIGGDQALLFGGWDNSQRFNDTWVYDLSDNTWTQDSNGEPEWSYVPQWRYDHGLSETSMDGSTYLVLFGGNDVYANSGLYNDETWTFGGGDYITTPMSYSSSTTETASIDQVSPGDTDKEIIRLKVVTTGSTFPISVTSITFNTTGTTNTSDITSAKVYYTTGTSFATTTQFGTTTANPSGSFTVTGSQTLSSGNNYFWLAYDISSNAAHGNNVDGQCTSVSVADTTRTPTVTDPAGSRTVMIADALSFDGTNDYVQIADHTSLDLTTNYTIEAWIYPESFNWLGGIVGKYHTSGSNGYFLRLHSSSPYTGFGFDGMQTATGILSANQWVHVAGVNDNGTRKLYLNGVEQTSGSGATVVANSDPLCIGVDYLQSPRYFDGRIDEVRIWNVVRTEAQIRDNMCRKLTGSESGLAGYWRFDEGTGTTAGDSSTNSNNGTLTNGPGWVTSGAAIGDASANDYSGSAAGDFSANLAHTDGDNITATGDGGTVTGIQVYRVDQAPNATTPPSGYNKIDPLRYWGVFIVGTSPTYTVTYNYAGHPGITTESALKLAYRADNSTPSWTDLAATLDEGANTLTKTGQSGTEYILGTTSSDNSLPVELSSFTASVNRSGAVVLQWVTESEIDNLGFHVYRALEAEGEYERLTSELIEGAGTSTGRREYAFTDVRLTNGVTYWYKIEDVAFDGTRTIHGPISVTPQAEEAVEVQALPTEFGLSQNFPNPFNPATEIRYQVPEASHVVLAIYDVLGQEVRVLVDGFVDAGYRSVVWDAEDAASGIYLVRMEAGDFVAVRKMALIR